MQDSHLPSRGIHILRDEVSRKIAAGEVIDRPFSIVRELLDNAIDAGAASIDVHLEAGGMGRVRVVDDGAGMSREDLALCWHPHATSKIETEDDLLRVASLGFRGEALSSVALCSRLSVTSSIGRDGPAHRVDVQGGRQLALEACQGRKGTVVDVSELFFNYPARKKFLRSASSESGLCRTVFIDRAVAHPGISFRLFTEGNLRQSLPVAGPVERVALAYNQLLDGRLLGQAGGEGDGLSVSIVAGTPDLRRRDRRLLQCFVNGRRVTEYAIGQAAEYGFAGYIPGGWYPVAFVFVRIDPSLVDFNIHPAKKEVRFLNLPDVRRVVSATVHSMLGPAASPATTSPEAAAPKIRLPLSFPSRDSAPISSVSSMISPSSRPGETLPLEEGSGIRFLGQVFGVFLVFELPGRVLLLDQHAAHERIIFERLGSRAPEVQELLFPLCFDVSEEEDRRLAGAVAPLEELGVALRRAGVRAYEVTALTEDLRSVGEDRLVELLREAGGEEWRRGFLAGAACRLAIKDGDRVDPVTAVELCARALALPVARCPHGRPLWHELSEDSLRRLVDRPIVT